MENKNVNEMDIIELTRELGKKLQKEDIYLKFQLAKQAADEDAELQKMINEFGLKREEISEETSKNENEQDSERIQKLNREMRKVYAKIMTNERMINYNDTKDEFDVLMKRITTIIQESSEGENPETADYIPCTGSCATCGGCG